MAEAIVLDANVIVALLYEQDAKHADAKALIDRISAASLEPQLVDFLVLEALSAINPSGAPGRTCRRWSCRLRGRGARMGA